MAGTLALVGAGEFLPSMDEVDRRLLARSGGKRVAVLPTASAPDGPGVPERWAQMGKEHFESLGAEVRAVMALDRAACCAPANAEAVAAADLVYFSGGKPGYLLRVLTDSAVWAAALRVFERGGVIAGCSAGAMILGGYVPDFRVRLGPPQVIAWRPAFALLPNAVVIPHFDELPGFLMTLPFGRLPPGAFLLGIEGGTALVGAGTAWDVMGRGGVTIARRGMHTRLAAGEGLSL